MNKFETELKAGNFVTSECSYCEKIVKCDKNVLVESYCCKTNTIELEGFVYKKNRWEMELGWKNK